MVLESFFIFQSSNGFHPAIKFFWITVRSIEAVLKQIIPLLKKKNNTLKLYVDIIHLCILRFIILFSIIDETFPKINYDTAMPAASQES